MINQLLYIVKLNLLASFCVGASILISRLIGKKYTTLWKYVVWLVISLLLLIPVDFTPSFSLWSVNVNMQLDNESSVSNAETFETDTFTSNTAIDNLRNADADAGTLSDTSQSSLTDTANAGITSPAESQVQPDKYLEGKLLSKFQSIFSYVIALPLHFHLLIIWLITAMLLAVFRLVSAKRALHRLRLWNIPEKDIVVLNTYRKICAQKKIRTAPILVRNATLTSPQLLGLIRPVIYLPKTDYSVSELELIFHHELTHYQRKDLWYKLLLLIINTIYWFNPALYIMRSEADKDIEYLCDDTVIRLQTHKGRQEYSRMLLDTAMRQAKATSYLSSGLNDGTTTLKKRILNILNSDPKKYGVSISMMILTLFLILNVLFDFRLVNASAAPVLQLPAASRTDAALSAVTTKPSLAIEDMSMEQLEKMLPIFDTLRSMPDEYSPTDSYYYWNIVALALSDWVHPGDDTIAFTTLREPEKTYSKISYSSDGVKNIEDEFGNTLLQVPGWIVREFASAAFPDSEYVPELPDSRFFQYYETGDYYLFLKREAYSANGGIESYEKMDDGSYLVQTDFLTARIVRNLPLEDGLEPLFPYEVIESGSADSSEEAGSETYDY